MQQLRWVPRFGNKNKARIILPLMDRKRCAHPPEGLGIKCSQDRNPIRSSAPRHTHPGQMRTELTMREQALLILDEAHNAAPASGFDSPLIPSSPNMVARRWLKH